MNITYRQKANLFHMLVLFPLIFLAINDDLINHDTEVLKKIVSIIIVAGIFYHLYLFMYVNSVASA